MIDQLAKFDDAVAPEPIGTASVIPNGFYTINFSDGSHRTFRIHTKRATAKFAPGQRILSMLIGPDNTSDYDPFAFVTDAGVKVWKRHVGTKLDQYAMLVWSLAAGEAIEGYTLDVSKRCLKCNRLLTDPVSLSFGLGPQCRGG